jgi:hypothetical protein
MIQYKAEAMNAECVLDKFSNKNLKIRLSIKGIIGLK